LTCSHAESSNCKIFNRYIVIDANFVISLLNSISNEIDPALDWRGHLANVTTQLKRYFDKFCKCSCTNKLLTSDLVMNNELDPFNTGRPSTVNKKWDFLYHLRRNYGTSGSPSYQVSKAIKDLLTAYITPITVTNEEVNQLRNIFGPNGLSSEDLSLIICSAKQPSLIGALTVTSDSKLEKAIEKVMTDGKLNLQEKILDTGKIFPVDNYGFITFLHRCCEISNHESLNIFTYILVKDFERRQNMGEQVTKAKTTAFAKSLQLRDEIVVYKEKKLAQKM